MELENHGFANCSSSQFIFHLGNLEKKKNKAKKKNYTKQGLTVLTTCNSRKQRDFAPDTRGAHNTVVNYTQTYVLLSAFGFAHLNIASLIFLPTYCTPWLYVTRRRLAYSKFRYTIGFHRQQRHGAKERASATDRRRNGHLHFILIFQQLDITTIYTTY